ncbi:hypothetical protein [Campylobacter sp. CCS1377]|uniref:Uncharacterized protein n=1 Tax=Campylobacter sp. CCS1377 TaxID=3158229 RepID=A0AAU7E5P6_9BACT
MNFEDINKEFFSTKKGKELIYYLKNKYEELFYKAKNAKEDKERLKALDAMAFLDEIITNLKD